MHLTAYSDIRQICCKSCVCAYCRRIMSGTYFSGLVHLDFNTCMIQMMKGLQQRIILATVMIHNLPTSYISEKNFFFLQTFALLIFCYRLAVMILHIVSQSTVLPTNSNYVWVQLLNLWKTTFCTFTNAYNIQMLIRLKIILHLINVYGNVTDSKYSSNVLSHFSIQYYFICITFKLFVTNFKIRYTYL